MYRNFTDKPALKKLLETGKVGIGKLARIASIATKENQEFLAEQVMLLSQKALETLVRDIRMAQQVAGDKNKATEHENQLGWTELSGRLFQDVNSLPQPQNAHEIMRAHDLEHSKNNEPQPTASGIVEPKIADSQLGESQTATPLKLLQLKLSARNLGKLLELQEKGIDINQLITSMLTEREEEIAQEKEELSAQAKTTKSKYVKVGIKKLFTKEYGNKCAKPGCQKPSIQIHHADRFAMSQVHDPRFMAPLCAQHHQIAHTIDQKYQMKRLL